MRSWGWVKMLVMVALCAPAWGQAPDRSPLPQMRPGGAAIVVPTVPSTPAVTTRTIVAGAHAPPRSLRPWGRPGGPPASVVAALAAAVPEPASPAPLQQGERRGNGFMGGILRPRNPPRTIVRIPGETDQAVVQSLRPQLRPDGLEAAVRASATRQTPGRVAQLGVRGPLCGVSSITGDRLEPIQGRIRGCGIAEPVRVREINGIPLSTPATVNCETARALQAWLQNGAIPTVGRRGGGVASLRVVASYSCRARNSQAGARLSEHATGNAIDIAGIGLANGSEITVLSGWRDRQDGPLLQQMHRAACGPFGTVLGPNSDRFHRDHFHFDVARHRSGTYCR